MNIPKIVVLFTSYRCNARCVMCYAWQKQKLYPELSVEDIRRIFSDKLLSTSVEIVNLTGGEPTLRPELVDTIDTLAATCVHLKRIDISTNGINTEQVVDKVEQVLALLLPRKINLSVCVSVDGVSEVHDRVRGTPGAFLRIDRTIDELKDLLRLYPTFGLGLNLTINKNNYLHLKEAFEYSLYKALGMNFTLAALSEIGVESIPVQDNFELTAESKKEVVKFIEFLLLKNNIDLNYARFLLEWLSSGKRQGPCAFRKGESLLCEPNGLMYLCGNFHEFLLGNVLKEEFRALFLKRKNFSADYAKRCAQCNSNCYIDHD